MLNKQIDDACAHLPANQIERYLLYPALAVYSPLENLVKTAVGTVFTILSLGSFGLCSPINQVANWTRSSRGLVTIPFKSWGMYLASVLKS